MATEATPVEPEATVDPLVEARADTVDSKEEPRLAAMAATLVVLQPEAMVETPVARLLVATEAARAEHPLEVTEARAADSPTVETLVDPRPEAMVDLVKEALEATAAQLPAEMPDTVRCSP